MKPFPDLYRVKDQRGNRKVLYASIYKRLEIHSLSIENDLKTLQMSLPIFPEWVDKDNFITQGSLSLILDVIPGVYSMSINPFHPAAVTLGIRYFSRPKLGSILKITASSSICIEDKLGSLKIEVSSEDKIVATGTINLIYNQNSFWRSEKL